ncbi:hypothetical protein [Vibrio cholerae]|uniref:hypothetical protein n=1 Tax=Vibrio cholerae TaxID=666 RepID=UPI0030194F2B
MSNNTICLGEASKVIEILEIGSSVKLPNSTRDLAIQFVERLLNSGRDYELNELIELMLLVDDESLHEFASICKQKIY